ERAPDRGSADGGAAAGRRRADDDRGRGCDRERVLRRDRRSATAGAAHAGASASGIEGGGRRLKSAVVGRFGPRKGPESLVGCKAPCISAGDSHIVLALSLIEGG